MLNDRSSTINNIATPVEETPYDWLFTPLVIQNTVTDADADAEEPREKLLAQ